VLSLAQKAGWDLPPKEVGKQERLLHLARSFERLIEVEGGNKFSVNGMDGYRRAQQHAKGKRPKSEAEYLDPPTGIPTIWDADAIQSALTSHYLAQFSMSGYLIEAMLGDSRIGHALNKRTKGVLKCKPYLSPNPRAKDKKLAKFIADQYTELWYEVLPFEMQEQLWVWSSMAGWSLFNQIWGTRQEDMYLPEMKFWHPSFQFFLMSGDPSERRFQAITMGGGSAGDSMNVPIEIGDPDWFLYAPYSTPREHGYRTWIRGACRQVGIPYLVRNYALRDFSRFSELMGIPLRAINVPADAMDDDKSVIFQQIVQQSSEAIIVLPTAADGTGYQYQYIESKNAEGHKVFKELAARCDSDIELAINGTMLLSAMGSSDSKTGSNAAAKSVRSEDSEYSEADAMKLATMVRKQIWAPITNYNYEDGDELVPLIVLADEPPEEKTASAQVLLNVSQALVNYEQVGAELDLAKIGEQFDIPFTSFDLVPPEQPETQLQARELRKTTQLQALVFDKDDWELTEAKQWCKAHGYLDDASDTPEAHVFDQRSIGDFILKSMKDVSLGEGVFAHVGKLTPGDGSENETSMHARRAWKRRHAAQAGQDYVDKVAELGKHHGVNDMRHFLAHVQQAISVATTPEEAKANLKRMARELKHGSLETTLRNSRLMAHLAGRSSESDVRTSRMAFDPDQPRGPDGKWDPAGGSGSVKSDTHGEGRVHTQADLLKSVPKDSKGKQTYEGFPVSSINKVHEFSGETGLKAVVFRKDRNGKEVQTYKYTSEHDQRHADARFEKAAKMGEHIHELRDRLEKDSKSDEVKTRDAAVVTRLIDHTTIRVGGSDSEKETGSVGATTLRAEHVHENKDGSVDLRFPGKSHKDWDRHIEGPLAHELSSRARGMRSDEQIFKVNAADVNKYLEGASPIKITAKDFRTFHASSMAHSILSKAMPPPSVSAKEAEAVIKKAVEATAKHLGNTPAICKEKYINPRVIDAYRNRAVSGKKAA
jgi:DNA topoisomerase-1